MSVYERDNAGLHISDDTFQDDEGDFDIKKFVINTTNEIWDEQNFDKIYDYFADDFVSYGAEGREFNDLDQLFDYVFERTAAFPDTKVFVDDLFWVGDDETGYRTSHCFTVTGTSTGKSKYGAPTGKRLRLSGIANCKVEKVEGKWKYTEERAEDDQFAIARACTPGPDIAYPVNRLEESLESVAEKAGSDLQLPSDDEIHRKNEKIIGGIGSRKGFSPGNFLLDLVKEVWNGKSIGKLENYYSEDIIFHAASGRELRGLEELRQDVLDRLSAFPSLKMIIEDLLVFQVGSNSFKTSLPYTIIGKNSGHSKYGPPTNRSVKFTGIANRTIKRLNGDWKVTEKWEGFDERRLMAMDQV